MRVSRRAFIFSGLFLASGWAYWKVRGVSDDSDIELFLANYESVIPVKDVLNTNIQISLFEKKILSMLASMGVAKTIVAVNQIIKNEYQSEDTRLMNGWIVSETEFKILILKKNRA